MVPIIVGGRGAGKTQQAAEWVKEAPRDRVVVVASREQAHWVRNHFGLIEGQVMTFAEVKAWRGRRKLELCIDDAEQILQMLLHDAGPVRLATWNDTSAEQPEDVANRLRALNA